MAHHMHHMNPPAASDHHSTHNPRRGEHHRNRCHIPERLRLPHGANQLQCRCIESQRNHHQSCFVGTCRTWFGYTVISGACQGNRAATDRFCSRTRAVETKMTPMVDQKTVGLQEPEPLTNRTLAFEHCLPPCFQDTLNGWSFETGFTCNTIHIPCQEHFRRLDSQTIRKASQCTAVVVNFLHRQPLYQNSTRNTKEIVEKLRPP